MVEVRHFRSFATVAATGSFGKAARELNVTQPAVSRLVAQLERRLGVTLLDRSQQPVRLTVHGANLLPLALRALAAFDSALEPPRRGRSVLRLGFGWLGCDPPATRVIGEFEDQHPDCVVRVLCSDSHMAGLDDGSTDIAVLRCEPDPALYDSRMVWLEERVIALPAGHVLARQQSVRLEDLHGESLVATVRPGVGFVNQNLALWRARNPTSRIINVRNVREWFSEIALGRGIGFASAPAATGARHPDVVFLPVDADPVHVLLVWPKSGAHPHCDHFIRTALDYVERCRQQKRTADSQWRNHWVTRLHDQFSPLSRGEVDLHAPAPTLPTLRPAPRPAAANPDSRVEQPSA